MTTILLAACATRPPAASRELLAPVHPVASLAGTGVRHHLAPAARPKPAVCVRLLVGDRVTVPVRRLSTTWGRAAVDLGTVGLDDAGPWLREQIAAGLAGWHDSVVVLEPDQACPFEQKVEREVGIHDAEVLVHPNAQQSVTATLAGEPVTAPLTYRAEVSVGLYVQSHDAVEVRSVGLPISVDVDPVPASGIPGEVVDAVLRAFSHSAARVIRALVVPERSVTCVDWLDSDIWRELERMECIHGADGCGLRFRFPDCR